MTSGFLLINKPPGPTHVPESRHGRATVQDSDPLSRISTSHDVINYIRRITGIRTIGHAGTLDPFAEGLLIVGVGREATKRLDQFKNLPKTYMATLRLGATSDTDDATGKLQVISYKLQVTRNEIENVLKQFAGEIEQIPPMYSAKKVGGKKLYELARKGQTIERKPTTITIFSITLTSFTPLTPFPSLTLRVTCSTGTYIRALARDIGEKLGCGAYCEALVRTAIGPHKLEHAVPLGKLNPHNWQSTVKKLEAGSWKLGNQTDYTNSKFQIPNSRFPIKVLVFGTFDHLHPGHLDFFKQAKALGDHLIVGVGRDTVVTQIKGRPSRQNEKKRLQAVHACGLADEALLLPENPEDRFSWIKKMAPDIIALGYDQAAFTENLAHELKRHAINCQVARLQPFKPERYKSSKMG